MCQQTLTKNSEGDNHKVITTLVKIQDIIIDEIKIMTAKTSLGDPEYMLWYSKMRALLSCDFMTWDQ